MSQNPDKTKDLTRRLCIVAMLVTMQIVLGRIAAINVGQYLKISFGFIPIAVCGMLTGPVWTVLMAIVCDILGATLFPSGAFYWGFTLVAAAGGLIYGLYLHGYEPNMIRSLLCTFTICLVCNVGLNTFFLCRTGAIVPPGNEAFWPIFWTRVLKNAVQFPVNGLILFAVWKAVKRLPAAMRKV